MMIELLSRADVNNAIELCSLGCFSTLIEVAPSGPTIVGIMFAFVSHWIHISILRS